MFRRPSAAVRRLAMSDEMKPAMLSEDVNSVKSWLSYTQYMFVLASAAFFNTDGKNLLRNGSIVVTPPDLNTCFMQVIRLIIYNV